MKKEILKIQPQSSYQKQGKKNQQAGARFERKVRADLEDKGWIVSKWQNNVEFYIDAQKSPHVFGKLIPAKQGRFRKTSTGFPDFICMKRISMIPAPNYEVFGVEAKSKGYLSKEEKEKCKWLLDNNIFNKILIASKGKKRGSIEYNEFS